jgi:RND family efflux transporter MFP subunit
VSQAQLSLDSAQRSLEETQLTAPISGTVTAVDAQVGAEVGTAAIITLADLQAPQIQFWVEESDMASAAVGNAVNITFDALPDYVYPGKILSVDPTVVTVSNTPAIQATASIDLSTHPVQLLSGMNASVEVVAGQALNALLVPVDALREIADGQYAVFVVQPDGQLEMRPVKVGLKDLVNAEILSGLQEGETVTLASSTGTQTTTSTQTQNSTRQSIPEGPMPFFGGQP